MILTRCPNCRTVFRVTPEQLRIRHGQVRCGSCFATFNALAELMEETSVPGATPAGGKPESSAEPFTAEIASAPFASGLDEAPMVSDTPPETGEAHQTDTVPADEDMEFIDIGVLPGPASEAEPEMADAGAVIEPGAEVELEVVDVGSPPESGIEPHAEPPAELPPESEPALQPEADRPAESQPAAEPSAEPAILIEPDHKPRSLETGREPLRWLWWTGAVAAFGALILQAVIHFRTDLALRFPDARPALETLCAQVGCDIALPARIDLLEIEHSDLVPDDRNAGRLLLSATVRNLAAHPQTWPHLELTLTDAHDRPLVRRALAPKDYLPSSVAAAAGFPARSEQHIQLEIRAADVPAVGYRLYLFFP